MSKEQRIAELKAQLKQQQAALAELQEAINNTKAEIKQLESDNQAPKNIDDAKVAGFIAEFKSLCAGASQKSRQAIRNEYEEISKNLNLAELKQAALAMNYGNFKTKKSLNERLCMVPLNFQAAHQRAQF
jgi:chromosome segregation ATPase